METREIMQDVINAQLEEGGTQTVSEAKAGVEERMVTVQENVRALFGESSVDVIAGLDNEKTQWMNGIGYDNSIIIDSIGEQGAAGMHNLSSRVTTLDQHALDIERDEAYWKRVEAHEVEGHGNQASSFNTQVIVHAGAETSLTCLLEWDAITTADQPGSDLTPEYKEYLRRGEEIAAIVGHSFLKNALHTGDLLAVQDEIYIVQIRGGLGLPDEKGAHTALAA